MKGTCHTQQSTSDKLCTRFKHFTIETAKLCTIGTKTNGAKLFSNQCK